jgi:hypothetical protein
MRKFYLKIILYAVISILITSVVLIYACINIYPKSRIPNIKLQFFLSNQKLHDSVNLVLGSSHALNGIDTKVMDDNYFNFASTSQTLMEDYGILKYLEANKYPIKKIILPFSYFSNWAYLYKTPMLGEQIRRFDYQSTFNITYPILPTLDLRLKYISELSKCIFPYKTIDRIDKMGNKLGTCNFSKFTISDAQKAFSRHDFQSNFAEINLYFDSINNFCFRNNVDLFIVIFPFTKSYRQLVDKTKFDYLIKFLKIKYSSDKCFFLDRRDHFKQFDESVVFCDADHLSFCGRELFSLYIKNQIDYISTK